MKTIGLIGGMSWESTVTYYRVINEEIKKRLGGFHSGKILLYSVDFEEIEKCQMSGEWKKSGEILADAAKRLEKAGADFIVICTNTMHKVFGQVQAAVKIPVLHIAETTAEIMKKDKITKTGLLGTKFTMEQDFYKSVLAENGIEAVVPDEDGRKTVNDVIYNELCMGQIKESSKKQFLKIIEKLRDQGAQAVILGCTEIGLLVEQKDVDIPVYDTALIHAEVAAEKSLK